MKRIKMKICAIICEYNPFHNGHLYQLKQAKALSNADFLLCIMSGNFVQRGEAAIMEKHMRAKHAVMAGADAVIELPTPFATSNAELFAKGAIHILSSIPNVSTLCFGAEKADKLAFISAARYLNDEPKEVSETIKRLMSEGVSYAKARAQAYAGFIPIDLLASPNNILGLEYTRAILSKNANIDILPIQRVGGNYNDENLHTDFSSATAIRAGITKQENISAQLPTYVAADLPNQLENKLDSLEKYALLSKSTREIALVADCTEGLENAFKKAAENPESLVQSLTSARYTASRIRRIALQCLLNIEESLIRKSLQAPLYLRVLAAKKDNSAILSALSESNFPIIARAHDEASLLDTAKECYSIDTFAEKLYRLLYQTTENKNIFI
ncbi:MAG: nucleotidyltransferase family protein [Clostridiales bacterium]|nr:nucleotidyltransferase family protein [Clostridiales bacterium]